MRLAGVAPIVPRNPRCSESARETPRLALRWGVRRSLPVSNRRRSWRLPVAQLLLTRYRTALEAERVIEGNGADPFFPRSCGEAGDATLLFFWWGEFLNGDEHG
jgi:hypothetical protein